MQNFDWLFPKKNNDSWALIGLVIFFVLFVIKSVIESDNLPFYILCLLWWLFVYFILNWREKKNKSRPASLWKIFEKKYPIIIQYAPPKWINPAEAGLLYNCNVEPTDLTSLIYQWKFEKLIDIKTFVWEHSEKDYIKLIKKEDMPLTRPLFETEIFDSIFAMSDVKIIEWAFQLRYALMLEDLEYHWIRKWWIYRFSLWKVRKYIYSFLVILLFLWLYSLFFVGIRFYFPLFLALLVSLFLLCVFLWWLVNWWWRLKYTEKWAELASKLIGYRNFIKSCDENKIKLLLKEDPLFVDRTLPYATAFGLETEFLNKISPLRKDWNAKYVRGTKVPSWVWVLRFFIKDDNSWF